MTENTMKTQSMTKPDPKATSDENEWGDSVNLYDEDRLGNNAVWFRRHIFGVLWVPPQFAYVFTPAKLRLVASDCDVSLFCAN